MKHKLEEAMKLVDEMTLQEKISLLSGEDTWHTKSLERLGIPSVSLSDGPHGLRKQVNSGDNLGIGASVPATCFPTASLSACSFDRELLWRMGIAIAEECNAEDVDVILGPGINLKRSPLCGRNFEYFSEDPYLSAQLGIAYVEGVQESGIGVSLKHFAVNNQEKRRMTVSAMVDERTLHELYLRAFQRVVTEAHPMTVMSSYNRVNGTYVNESEALLKHTLRESWGFDGLVVSDWGSIHNRVKSITAGVDLEMPGNGGIQDQKILDALKDGRLSEEELDQTVCRLVAFALQVKDMRLQRKESTKEHHGLAIQIAEESMVLLKNKNQILPLQRGQSVAVIGELAEHPRIQGAGSSKITPTKVENLLENLKEEGNEVHYARGYSLEDTSIRKKEGRYCRKAMIREENLRKEALELCGRAETILVFAGLPEGYESEGVDREHLRLPESQNLLIEELASLGKHLVVVLMCGAPVELPWVSEVDAVLLSYLGGEGTGAAITRILSGKVSPSGRLAESWPIRLEDTPSYGNFPGEGNQVSYTEGTQIGYRYYGTNGISIQFPFGYGLSYSEFSYGDVTVNQDINTSENKYRYGDRILLQVPLRNQGAVRAKESTLVFCSHEPAASTSSGFEKYKPSSYQLVGFCKTELEAGESKTVQISIDTRDLCSYDVMQSAEVLKSGTYRFYIGMPESGERLNYVDVKITGNENLIVPGTAVETDGRLSNFTEKGDGTEFLGESPNRPFTMDHCLEDTRNTRTGRFLIFIVDHVMHYLCRREPEQEKMMIATAHEMPFFAIYTSAAGAVSEKTMRRLLHYLNGHILRAIFSP